jgi:hypothetical protein
MTLGPYKLQADFLLKAQDVAGKIWALVLWDEAVLKPGFRLGQEVLSGCAIINEDGVCRGDRTGSKARFGRGRL